MVIVEEGCPDVTRERLGAGRVVEKLHHRQGELYLIRTCAIDALILLSAAAATTTTTTAAVPAYLILLSLPRHVHSDPGG